MQVLEDILVYLIRNKANFNIIDLHDNTILAIEARNLRYENVKFLINMGGNPNTLIYRNYNYKTLLMNVISDKNIDMVKFLLDKKVDIELLDPEGSTALFYAAHTNNIEIIKMILSAGANIYHENYNDTTFFNIIMNTFNIELINYLIEKYNFDINCIDKSGNSLLHLACAREENSIKFLIEKKINLNIVNYLKQTALIVLCNEYNPGEEIIRLLIENNADVNLQDNKKYSALTYAIINNYINIVKILVELENTNINIIATDGSTPLITAAIENSYDIIKYLVDKGADLNIQDIYGNTALIIAADHEDIDIAKYLYDKGTNINLERIDGKKAYNMTDDENILSIFGIKTNDQLLEDEEFCNKIKTKEFNVDELLCVICKNENINCISDCDHKFCSKCLLKWYILNKNCPICRKIIKEITFMKDTQ